MGQFYQGAPSFGKIRALVNLMWYKWQQDITVSKLETENAFLFRIPNISARKRVLQEGLWSIDGSSMFVAPWTPGFTPSKPALKSAPVWIELRKVPLEFYNPKSLSHIASLVGNPICLHKETIVMTNFEVVKVFTEISLLSHLPETVCAQFESGEIRRVEVSCPHLPPVCKLCNEPGHSSKRCSKAPPLCPLCKKAYHATTLCPLAKTEVAPAVIVSPKTSKLKYIAKSSQQSKAMNQDGKAGAHQEKKSDASRCSVDTVADPLAASFPNDLSRTSSCIVMENLTVTTTGPSSPDNVEIISAFEEGSPAFIENVEHLAVIDKGKGILSDPPDPDTEVIEDDNDFTVVYSKMTKKKQKKQNKLGSFPISKLLLRGLPLRNH